MSIHYNSIIPTTGGGGSFNGGTITNSLTIDGGVNPVYLSILGDGGKSLLFGTDTDFNVTANDTSLTFNQNDGIVVNRNNDGIAEEIDPYTQTVTISPTSIIFIGNNSNNDHTFTLYDGGVWGKAGSDEGWGLNEAGVGGSAPNGDSSYGVNYSGVGGQLDPDTVWSFGISGIHFVDGTTQTTASIPEAPMDGNQYVRQNGQWVSIS